MAFHKKKFWVLPQKGKDVISCAVGGAGVKYWEIATSSGAVVEQPHNICHNFSQGCLSGFPGTKTKTSSDISFGY